MEKKDKRNSFLDKVGGTFRLGKEKTKPKSTSAFPKGGFQDDANSNGGFTDSPFNQMDSMSDKEVHEKFEKMLDDMNLTEEKKAPLRGRNIAIKRSMLTMHYKGASKPKGDKDTPQDFIAELFNADLKGEKRLRVLESLRVSLTSNPVSWITEFGEKGFNGILRNLTYCCDSKSDRRSTYECVRCLKAYMNNKYGLLQILNHEEALIILSRTIDPSDPATMLEAVRLLAALCLVPPNGQEKALEGITVCGEIRSQDRFIPIIMGLGMRDNIAMQVACMQLVNAIVSTPEDLDFRLHLRNEFMRNGLNQLLPLLDQFDDNELKTHVDIFNVHKEEDHEEFSHRYDNVRLELEDTQSCFNLLNNTVMNTVAEPYFLSILQHLLSIRDDTYSRPQYYKLIEECVTQIVLHRSGVDPDFKATQRFDIDVEPLLSSLSEKSKFEDTEGSIDNNKFHEALTAKQEAEAKVTGLEEKVKAMEQENVALKQKVSDGIGAVVSSAINKGPGGGPPGPGGVPPPPPPPFPGGAGGGPPPPPPPPFPGGGGVPPPPPPPFPGGGVPPPPPFPGGGGPPPPPPFPGMGGPPRPPGFMSPPGAPSPPTNVLPYGMTMKKKYNINTQTKRLNWNKVNTRNLDKEALWVKINEEELESDEFLTGLREQFAVKAPPKKESEDVETKKPGRKVKELKVLDGKSGQNLSIFLGSIKVPYDEIKRRILAMDEELLSATIIEQLIKFIPSPEDMNKIASFKDEYNDLAEAEQFCVKMSSIKRLTPRLNSMLFKMRFPELVSDIKPDLVAGTEACEEVIKSKKFAKLMELVLLTGNYLNAGSRNAQTIGFDISFLTKLQNTKSQDGKTTLLHYLADMVDKKYPDIAGFIDELSYTDKAARVSDEQINKNLKGMDTQLKQLEIDLKNIQKQQHLEGDEFSNVMNQFITVAQDQYDVLHNMHKKLDSLFTDLSKYLTFDTQKKSLEDFFGDLKAFKDGFVTAQKENAKLHETEEKIRRAKEIREKADREKKDKKARQKALLDMTTDDDQEGVMDNLLEALKTGSAFSVNREKRAANRKTPRAAGAERRAQLARSRSRQDLLNVNSSTAREINFDDSNMSNLDSPANPKTRTRRAKPTATPEESEAAKLLARLKEL